MGRRTAHAPLANQDATRAARLALRRRSLFLPALDAHGVARVRDALLLLTASWPHRAERKSRSPNATKAIWVTTKRCTRGGALVAGSQPSQFSVGCAPV